MFRKTPLISSRLCCTFNLGHFYHDTERQPLLQQIYFKTNRKGLDKLILFWIITLDQLVSCAFYSVWLLTEPICQRQGAVFLQESMGGTEDRHKDHGSLLQTNSHANISKVNSLSQAIIRSCDLLFNYRNNKALGQVGSKVVGGCFVMLADMKHSTPKSRNLSSSGRGGKGWKLIYGGYYCLLDRLNEHCNTIMPIFLLHVL